MIRTANSQDAPAIAGLWNAMIRETLSTFTTVEKTVADVEQMISDRDAAVVVAERGGACLGFATFGPFRGGPGYAATAEHTIIVAPEANRSGLGGTLLAAIEEVARGQGVHVMVAAISHTNTAAEAFHSHQGYREVARMPEVGRKAGQWLDLVLMQKTL